MRHFNIDWSLCTGMIDTHIVRYMTLANLQINIKNEYNSSKSSTAPPQPRTRSWGSCHGTPMASFAISAISTWVDSYLEFWILPLPSQTQQCYLERRWRWGKSGYSFRTHLRKSWHVCSGGLESPLRTDLVGWENTLEHSPSFSWPDWTVGHVCIIYHTSVVQIAYDIVTL